jgi:hypothetical protein
VQHAREVKLRELQQKDPTAWPKPLDPGPRTKKELVSFLSPRNSKYSWKRTAGESEARGLPQGTYHFGAR